MKVKWADNGLDRLKPNMAGSVELNDGSNVSIGVIRVDGNKLVHYTGKGLREIWGQDMNETELVNAERLKKILKEPDGEEQLKRSGHVAVLAIADIARVLP